MHKLTLTDHFGRFASTVADRMGSPWAFVAAFAVIVAWALMGPNFAYSDTWQIIINTGTTIVTFLMVFILQSTQNRDSRAIHLKLDELIRSNENARNKFAALQDASERELTALQREFAKLSGVDVLRGKGGAPLKP